MAKKMNIQVSPESQTVAQSDQQRILKLLEEIDPIIRKHGFDYYLFSVHTPHGSKGGLLTSGLSTNDVEEAAALLSDAFRVVQQLANTQRPTAPGGRA